METLSSVAGPSAELRSPASVEVREWLERQFAAFDLVEYLRVLAESNGIGEVFPEGSQRFVHNMLLVPAEEALEASQSQFEGRALVIGNAGVDGIRYVLQPGSPAVYAFYPIDQEFRFIAPSVLAFLRKWAAGEVRL